VKVTVNKVDEANVLVSGTIEKGVVEANIERLAVQAGKEMKVDGFRKGKVPILLMLVLKKRSLMQQMCLVNLLLKSMIKLTMVSR